MKPIDLSKFRKTVQKSLGITDGFHDPKTWITTGNYALNYRISNSFFKGIPLSKVTVFAGESGCLPKSAKVLARIDFDEKIITVGELKNYFLDDSHTISLYTPDGWQNLTEWFNKGVLPCVEITTKSGNKTVCAYNHLIETFNGNSLSWVAASDLRVGNGVLVIKSIETVFNSSDDHGSIEEVISVRDAGPHECYDFTIDHPNHRYWGDGFSSHNSGKSFVVSGNIVKNAQEAGILPIILDSEFALDEEWFERIGVDTAPDKLIRFPVSLVDDCAKIISDFMKDYDKDYLDVPIEERPKILFIIDSLGMLSTPSEQDQFSGGDMKGDMGRKPKQIKTLLTNCAKLFGPHNIGMVATNHVYTQQNVFQGTDDVISGGHSSIFAASIIVLLNKFRLKENEDGEKGSDVLGIRSKMKCVKSRFAQPFKEVNINIPYGSPLNPFSGLIDMFESMNVLVKDGNKLKYVFNDGTELKLFRKEWSKNTDALMKIMHEVEEKGNITNTNGVDETPSDDEINE